MRESEQPGRRGQIGTIRDSRPLWGENNEVHTKGQATLRTAREKGINPEDYDTQ